MPPTTAALLKCCKWQSPHHCCALFTSHIMLWMCLLCLQPDTAIGAQHHSDGKCQARQNCRREPPLTCLSGSGQPWGHLLCKAWKAEKKSSIAGIPRPFSAQITHAQQEPRVPLQGQHSVSSMKAQAFPDITSSSCFAACWAQLIYMEEPK